VNVNKKLSIIDIKKVYEYDIAILKDTINFVNVLYKDAFHIVRAVPLTHFIRQIARNTDVSSREAIPGNKTKPN